MAEEYLPGRNLAWQGVYRDGVLVGSIAWERIQYIIVHASPSGVTGTPSVAALRNDDDVHRLARRAVEAIDPRPTGIFGVDLKEDGTDAPRVTEINVGRFFTPSYMYARGGYNLVRAFFDVALGRPDASGLPVRAHVPDDLYWLRGIDLPPTLRRL